jgi:hypothetical protein
MNKYHKIQTVYLRDMDVEGRSKPLLIAHWAKPEFNLLQSIKWTWYEKIDGTNIRVMYHGGGVLGDVPLEFRGKKDTSDMDPRLKVRLPEIITFESMKKVFGVANNVCLYGEGYGNKIQKVGKLYLPDDQGFILFDVKIGHIWLQRSDVEKIAESLNIPVVPIIGYGTLKRAISKVKNRFVSHISENCVAEGLVCRPFVDLSDRLGRRIITKIKCKDFK